MAHSARRRLGGDECLAARRAGSQTATSVVRSLRTATDGRTAPPAAERAGGQQPVRGERAAAAHECAAQRQAESAASVS